MKRIWENKGESFSDLLATSRGLSGSVMWGWMLVKMNLLRENCILLQSGRPPRAMNGVVSGRKNSGFILSGTVRDGRPMSRCRP
jgi:hypothetical protein